MKIPILRKTKISTQSALWEKKIIPHLTLKILSHEFQMTLPCFSCCKGKGYLYFSLYINSIGTELCANLHISEDYHLLKSKCILSFLHKRRLCQAQWSLILGHFTILGWFFLNCFIRLTSGMVVAYKVQDAH